MNRTNLRNLFLKYRGGKIAIIGNSDNICQNEYGNKINEYDCVIRFNGCYIDKKIEKHTGTKTDIVVLGANIDELFWCYSELYEKNDGKNKKEKVLNYYSEKFPDAEFILSKYHADTSNDVSLLEELIKKGVYIYVVNFRRNKYLKYGLFKTPTCGLVLIMNLLDIKDELDLTIDIFGFNKDEESKIIYEYYQPVNNPVANNIYTDKRCLSHRLLIERKIIKDLIAEGLINQY